ncbi:MAG: glutamate--tRNA ligase family protein, partial [Pseudomonadota bacterium]|nr:glutamate--tRNA ligase family protein [Pseudomonadota bacterium]
MRTRFAPSPTGPLHLGHAFSALTAARLAKEAQGTFLLRIEDIDQSRARAHWEEQIYDDLHWLGLTWPTPVMRQSDRMPVYRAALAKLWDQGLLYPCTCTRRDIDAALSAPQEGALHYGPDGPIYPGTCRHKPRPAQLPEGKSLRLDMAKAIQQLPET